MAKIVFLFRRRYETGPWLLWITNRKSWVAERSVSDPMTLSDLKRRGARAPVFFSGWSLHACRAR